MEINGVIVAKSEVFRLKSGYCCLLAIYNKCSDILLHLFIQGSRMLELKNKIQLNSCYKFFNLNYCSLKLISKKCVKVHQMGPTSNYQEILEEDVHVVELMSFLEYVTEESRTSRDHLKETSKLISYEGCVTAVKDVALGIYELDKKLLLYTTFLKLHSDTPSLNKGHKVFICNAHYQKEKCLVCCGLSLVIVLESQGQKDDERYPELKLIDELGLCFRDFIWIERSFESLKLKFCSSIISYENNPFNWKSDHAITIIEGLMKCSMHANTMNVLSRHCLIQEFISNPHSCVVTMQDKHNLYFKIPTISEILKMSKDDCEWNVHSKHWKTFVFNSTDNLVLIGMLQYHTDGTFYISDISGGAPVLFLQDYNESQDSCTVPCPRNIMCEISDKSIGFIVALKNFTLVFEECVDQALTTTNNVCICAKFQFLYILHKINYTVNDTNVLQNVFDLPVTEKKCESSLYFSNKGKNFSSNVHHSLDGCILHNEINNVNYDKILGLSDLFQCYLSLDCSIEHENVKKQIKMASPNDNVFCYVFVWSKTWPIFKNRELHQEAVVFLIGDQVFESSTFSDHMLSVQYSDEYSLNMETPIDASNSFDQKEPSLVSEENSFEKNYYFRPMLLCFKNHSIRSCAILVQGHMYLMPISRNELKKVLCFYSDSKIKYGMMQELLLDEIISIDILTEAKFVHVQQSSNMKIPSCVQTLPFLMQKHRIDDILKKRSISKFSFIRGVLVKKWYEDDMVSRSYSYEPAAGHLRANKKSLCLELRDCSSSNTIRIYTPEYEGSFYGLIPGAVVQIFGLSCQCSKKGNIYLKSSGPIGINILKIKSDFSNEASTSTGNQQRLFGQLQYSFRENPWSFLSKAIAGFKFYSSCFISCVLKVELFPVCAKCAENSPKDCFCSQSSVKAKASFIADDGSAQGFVYCADDTVRCLLNLTKPQWQIFLSYVQESEECLLYNHHILREDPISIIPSVFQAVCSSALIERQMILNCCAFPNSDNALSRYNSSYHKRDGPLMRFYCTFMQESKPREMSLHLFEHLKKQEK